MITISDPRRVKAMARVDILAAEARTMFRTVGPRISVADDLQDHAGIRSCRKCNPPPRTWTCPICDFETDAQWVFRMHLKFDPEWCQRRGEKKQRKWANNA